MVSQFGKIIPTQGKRKRIFEKSTYKEKHVKIAESIRVIIYQRLYESEPISIPFTKWLANDVKREFLKGEKDDKFISLMI